MSFAHDPVVTHCVRHPNRETALRCGKCGDPICTRCIVQTPVGARCATCANLKRLPQFDVGYRLLARAAVAGVVVSLALWRLISFLPYLRFFLSILVGAAVGEVMTRLALRRTTLALQACAVAAVAIGALVAEAARLGSVAELSSGGGVIIAPLIFPIVVASAVAVLKLR